MTATPRPGQPGSPEQRGGGEHWDAIYRDRGPAGVSWFQSTPAVSLELIEGLGLGPDDAVLDVGAGASTLLDALLERGHRDVTALDVAPAALAAVRGRAGVAAAIADGRAHTLAVDLRAWTPRRRYACWHDRAVFHFLTAATDRARYRAVAADTIVTGGYLVVGTFDGDGPTSCSGLATARYTPDGLAAALAPEFVAHHTRRELHHTPGGTVQPFTWQVLRRTGPPTPG